MKIGIKGWVLVGAVGVAIGALLAAGSGTDEKSPKTLDMASPIFVTDRAAGCQLIEFYTPSTISRCGTWQAQRVEVLQVAHEGHLLRIAPVGLPADTAQAVSLWTNRDDLHN